MKKRFLAILLCLSVLLMACACAAETMEPPAVSETESKAPAPQFTLSEVNAESSKTEEPVPSETAPAESEPEETISMEESDIKLEPIQPVEPVQPIVPEEKETTLEKVLSFDIGENGLFSYHFMYPQDASRDGNKSQRVSIETPNVCAVDENGYLYFFHVTDGKTYIYCATTGEKFQVSVPDNISSISVVDGRFFLSASNLPAYGFLEYSPKGLVNRYVSDQYTFSTGLRFDSEGQPYVSIPDVGFQTLDGMTLALETYPKISADKNGDQTIAYGNYLESITPSEAKKGIRIYGDRLIRSDGNTKVVYDLSENTLYQFTCNFSRDDSRSLACNISDGKSVVSSFIPETFSAAGFEIEALAIDLVISWDGTLYLLAFYPDHAELYRIDPGYSDATGVEIAAEEGAVASSSFRNIPAGCGHHTSEDHSHAHVTKEEALDRALSMCGGDYDWTLLSGHAPQKEDLPDGVKIPTYVAEANVGDTLYGIPYSYGQYYGLEDEWQDAFAAAVTETTNGVADYITGNVCHDARISGTIGLDCSGFVCSVYDFYLHCSSWWLDTCGHEILVSYATNASDDEKADAINLALEPMDLIVSEGFHCMLYLGPGDESDCIKVYDCTGGEGIPYQRTGIRDITVEHLETNGYIFRRMTCVYGSDATKHWYMCEYCDYESGKAEHDWIVPDATKPNEKYCKICKYCPQHNFTYVSDSATSHTRTCTVCGCSETEAHGDSCTAVSATQHVNHCMACGYSVTANHTFSYTYSSGGHVGTCSECSYVTETVSHEFEVTGVSGAHFFDCSVCGFSSGPIPHTFTYAYSNTVHVGTCSECGYRISGTHNMTVSPGDAGGHIYSCVCGKTTTQAHTFTYSTYSIIKHRQTCSTCGYSELASHLLSYSYDADGHWRECSLCSFETVSQAHNFVDSECTVCGCPQHIIMNIIAIPEEDEPLPVPEDQKATL